MKKMFHEVGYVVFKLIAVTMAILAIATVILVGVDSTNNFVWFVATIIAMCIGAICFDISRDFEMKLKEDRKDRRNRYYSLQKD